MDIWKYFDITHRNHIICNPMNIEKLKLLIKLLKLNDNSNVLEIACGKGEFLVRIAEQYNIQGIGVDISSFFIKDAKDKIQTRAPNADVKFIEMNGADYMHPEKHYFDLAACIGAEWIFNGFKGTLQYLNNNVKQNGLIIASCPFWLKEPAQEYLKAIDLKREAYGTHYDNMHSGEELGLQLIYTTVSNNDDWDNYEGLTWYSSIEYVDTNPEDEDNQELLNRLKNNRENYLRWGRNTFGWATYLFKKNES